MMKNNKTLYLVCDTQTDKLSIHEIEWNKYSYDPIPEEDDPWSSIYGKDPFGVEKVNFELGKKYYVKQQITNKVPNGVIVAAEDYNANFTIFEWDVCNFIKFEIHYIFDDSDNRLSLHYFLRPLAEKTIEGLNFLFGKADVSFEKNETFEPSQKGWLQIFERAKFLHNTFSKLLSDVDNTPYYNSNHWW